MSSSRDHSSFTGVPGICRDGDGLMHVILKNPPTEGTADIDLVHVAFHHR
jgi:hypothetical protein